MKGINWVGSVPMIIDRCDMLLVRLNGISQFQKLIQIQNIPCKVCVFDLVQTTIFCFTFGTEVHNKDYMYSKNCDID